MAERLKEQKTFSEMVHLHDDETHDKRTETHSAKRKYCRTSTAWAVAPDDDWYCGDAERRTDG